MSNTHTQTEKNVTDMVKCREKIKKNSPKREQINMHERIEWLNKIQKKKI